MSQATWPASAMILRSGIGAMKPRFSSSKSRWSAKGRVSFARCSASRVNFDGALPFGWKCPSSGAAASWASAGLSPSNMFPATANAAPAAGRYPMNSRRVVIFDSPFG